MAVESDASATPILSANAITAGYDDLPAIRDLSLEIHAGEVVALLGPNGAGKSTTLLALSGVISCRQGNVRWRGGPAPKRMHRMARDGLMFVPEGRTITTRLTVRENLEIGPGGVASALEIFPELERLLERPAGLCSGGEQQMVVLGRALAARPSALMVDELSIGLAPLVVIRLLAAVRRAADELGVAVLLVEQQTRRALDIADRWYLLNKGVLAATGDRAGGTKNLELAYLQTFRTTSFGAAARVQPEEPTATRGIRRA